MKRRTQVVIGLVIVAALAGAAHLFAASVVRGRLVRKGPYGEYPAGGVGVTVYALNSRIGRSPMSYSGTDGMYYIPNVPGGRYKLEIWISSRPRTFDISVNDRQAYTDIAPIVIP